MAPPSARSRSVLSKSTNDAETNIQVVVRCRRRSEREMTDNSPIIVTLNGAKSTELSIETALPQSSWGVVILPPLTSRTYPFDIAFGPQANQALIYHEVVAPILEEVVMGYNCTLFAYGQTGTGKTATSPRRRSEPPSANAGMIPGVIFRLFHLLESSASDFSVKISVILVPKLCSVSFSPDGARIASGSEDNTIRVWDAMTGQQVGDALEWHTDIVCSVAFSPDGARIASGSVDKTIRVWNAATEQQVVKLRDGWFRLAKDQGNSHILWIPHSFTFCHRDTVIMATKPQISLRFDEATLVPDWSMIEIL
ncbi:P-loop containing nucleoside triphosphate hydrolase protein [Mycena olivaceomarginata]|nr:P-loop containing nucleoside triphosphate hydrolase protein [Mycena olivaceomarginata]